MIAQRPDKHGVVRLWYQRPPQAFTTPHLAFRDTFLGCKLTPLGMAECKASYLAWLDKRDEWRAE